MQKKKKKNYKNPLKSVCACVCVLEHVCVWRMTENVCQYISDISESKMRMTFPTLAAFILTKPTLTHRYTTASALPVGLCQTQRRSFCEPWHPGEELPVYKALVLPLQCKRHKLRSADRLHKAKWLSGIQHQRWYPASRKSCMLDIKTEKQASAHKETLIWNSFLAYSYDFKNIFVSQQSH